jgi:hypothetical protein
VAPGYQDLDAVLAWLAHAGLAAEDATGARMVVKAHGTIEQVARTFDVPFGVLALVAPSTHIEWLCLPRFDSPSVFGALLDSQKGGSFGLESAGGPAATAMAYVPNTNVLRTRVVLLTNVGLEHTDVLGDTLEAIATEKLARKHGVFALRETDRVVAAFRHHRLHGQGHTVDHRLEEIALVLEMPVDRSARAARGLRDFLEGSVRHPFLMEDPLGRVEYGLAGRQRVFLGASGHAVPSSVRGACKAL